MDTNDCANRLLEEVKTWLGKDYCPDMEQVYKDNLTKVIARSPKDGYHACKILESLSWEVDYQLASILNRYVL